MRHALALLIMLLCCASANAQSAPRHYLSAATNNSTLVLGRSAIVKMIYAQNTNTTSTAYLKFYNKATAPTCGTDVPVMTVPLPSGATVGGPPAQPDISDGILFPLGVGFCITANFADNDNTATVTGIIVNVGVTGK